MEVANDPPPPPRRRRRKQRKEIQDRATVVKTSILELPSHITTPFPSIAPPRSPLSLILFRRSDSRHPSAFGFLPLADSPEALRRRGAPMKFETKPEIPAGSPLSMVSSCNGLVCLADRFCSDTVYICNPVTRQHLFLPKPKNEPSVRNIDPRYFGFGFGYGFGYSQSTDLFKVVKFTGKGYNKSARLHCCVHTLGVDAEWRNIGDTGQPPPHNSQFVFFNGGLHWIGSEGYSMLLLCYFDMEKEQCGNLPLPNLSHIFRYKSRVDRFHLGVVDNCLYIRDVQKFPMPIQIWVMKDYENIGSWTLEWTIHRQLPSWLGLDLKPLKTLKDGTVLMLVKEKTLASYNPVTKLFERVSYHGVHSWEESIADSKRVKKLSGRGKYIHLGEGSWRSIGTVPSNFQKHPLNAFLNGAIHWLALSVIAHVSSLVPLRDVAKGEMRRRMRVGDYNWESKCRALVNLVLVDRKTWPLCLVPLTVASKPLALDPASYSVRVFEPLKAATVTETQLDILHCCVYTLGVDDEWRNIGDTRQPLPHNRPFVFFNGALHWIGSEGSMLLLCYFDMEKEQCGNLPLPNLSAVPFQPKVTRFHLGVVDNCLYIRDEQKPPLPINIWVMKDYENIGSWTLEWPIHRQLPSWLRLDLKPLKTLKDGTVLMIVKEKTLASYNPVTKLFERVSYHGVHSWEESIADVPSFLPLPGAL
ncbi:hypothetical protein C3L33_11859, partial [Rhododendron williamsianum]